MSFVAITPSKLGFAQVKIGTPAAAAVTGAEQPGVPDASDRPGWSFIKDATSVATAKCNWFVGVPTTLTLDYGNVKGLWSILTIDDFTSVSSLPWLTLYTYAQGDGKDASWYRSQINYMIPHDRETVMPGERVCMWTGTHPPPAELLNGARTIQLVPTLIGVNPLAGDRVQFLNLQTDSSATKVGFTVETIAYHMHTHLVDGHLYNMNLVA
mgnify:CR=1 FL=1